MSSLARRAGVIVATLLAALALQVAIAQTKVRNGVLTDAAGMTLYVFDNDITTPGKSACTGPCLNMWTPLAAPADAKPQGPYTLVTRDDGSLQWAYNGRPLYRWYADKKPGDRDGDGLRRAWHVAVP